MEAKKKVLRKGVVERRSGGKELGKERKKDIIKLKGGVERA